MNIDRDYLSTDAAVWQFLHDSAPVGESRGKSAFLAIAHHILADSSYIQLID
jgi:hypothetical protein